MLWRQARLRTAQRRVAQVAAARAAARATARAAAIRAPTSAYLAKVAASKVGVRRPRDLPRSLAAAVVQRNRAYARYRKLSAIQPVPVQLANYDRLMMTAAFGEIALWNFASVEMRQYPTARDWPPAAHKYLLALRRTVTTTTRQAVRERARVMG